MRSLALGTLTITLALLLINYAAKINAPAAQYDTAAPVPPTDPEKTVTYYVYRTETGYRLVRGPSPQPGYVAVVKAWPGGYTCETNTTIRLGPNPFEGFWCPPPWPINVSDRCRPVAERSLGRVLLIYYDCR